MILLLRASALGCTAALLSSCGGSHSGAATINPYPGLGYEEILYRGTLTARNPQGETSEVPVRVTVSPDGNDVHAYGVGTIDPQFPTTSGRYALTQGFDDFAQAYRSFATTPVGTGAGTSTLALTRRTNGVTIQFAGEGGLTATVVAQVDAPSLTPYKPSAGTYEGWVAGRRGDTGRLFFSGPATGRVENDGTFRFTYVASGTVSSGEQRGTILGDGSITDDVEIRDFNGVSVPGSVLSARGSDQDLTILRTFDGGQVLTSFRMHRTGS